MSTQLNNIDLEEIKQKLYERLKPSGWADKLKTFILSSDFDKILMALLKNAQEGKRFTPQLKQIFRVFEECPYDSLKVVMLSHEPYYFIGIADGIAFSCSNTKLVEPALRAMFKEVEATTCKEGYSWDPDLTRWSNQGILMLNSALTATIGKSNQHYAIWQPFIAFLLDHLMCTTSGLVYVFIGNKAQDWSESVPSNNWKILCTHPELPAHIHERWDSEDMFNKVSDLVFKQFKYQIKW